MAHVPSPPSSAVATTPRARARVWRHRRGRALGWAWRVAMGIALIAVAWWVLQRGLDKERERDRGSEGAQAVLVVGGLSRGSIGTASS